MNIFSYKITHDYGLAPNPFHNYCTLAVCKPDIRSNKNLAKGDWVIGTGSKSIGDINLLIYAMKVTDKLTFDDYWKDPKFQNKKPLLKGSLKMIYGDNIYHKDSVTEEWLQEDSAHSLIDAQINQDHLEVDTGGDFVLISQNFYYFGDSAPEIPENLREICSKNRNMEYLNRSSDVEEAFIKWLEDSFEMGVHGDPINWKDHS
ncbi:MULTISPECIES: hypothetical protein [unclassified Psychrobacter]|uniref:Nmad2 family putative nucleotide modification protein n=1 Tax=unclassified Psychrobacter TaxID=196806 RepID=UPI00384AE2D4